MGGPAEGAQRTRRKHTLYILTIFNYFTSILTHIMKTLTLTLVLLLFAFSTYAQSTETRYCRDEYCQQVVPKERAKFSETTITDNGVVTKAVTILKTNQVVSRTGYRGDEPMGVWITKSGHGPVELDYDFEVSHGATSCEGGAQPTKIDDILVDNPSTGYIGPKVTDKEPGMLGLMSFTRRNLRFPSKARREGIQGTVDLIFTLTETGTIEDVLVKKGVHIVLDKEAVRVIRALKFQHPPMKNGKPQRMCVEMPVRFQLS